MRQQIYVSALCGLVGGFLGSALFNCIPSSIAQSNEEKVIKANEFVLVDKLGNQKASLGFQPDGDPILFLKGKCDTMLTGGMIGLLNDEYKDSSIVVGVMDKKPTITVGGKKDAAILSYSEEDGAALQLGSRTNFARISTTGDTTSIVLLSKKPGIILKDPETKCQATFGADGESGDASSIRLHDKAGNLIWAK